MTTVSEYSRYSINRHFRIPLSKIILTPNAISLNNISTPVSELTNRKFILFVSRVEPRKKQSLLIEVWKELNLLNEGYDLVIVGSEGLFDIQFENQIKNLSQLEKEHFHWLKGVSDGQLVWLYKNCELFVFPSIAEGFGIPPIEAAYFGAKVICSNKTAMSDFDFFGNYMFSPDSKYEFKEKLLWALESPFPHDYIINCIKSKYNWENIADLFAIEIIKLHEKG